jgi:dimethylamine/trimethylamine dehydrogenase
LARLWDEGDVINLGKMCEELHEHGSLAGVQLWYNGLHAPGLESREVPRAPSGLPSNVFPERNVYAAVADESDIKTFIGMYVLRQTRRASGFDFVEISGGRLLANAVPRRATTVAMISTAVLENRARSSSSGDGLKGYR